MQVVAITLVVWTWVMACSIGVAGGQPAAQALPSAVAARPWSAGEIETLSQQLRAVIAKSPLDSAHVGAILLPVDPAGPLVAQFNAEKLFVPASTLKLFTTAAALDTLGSEYRFTTSFSHTGMVKDGVLHGDLIVRSNGDPSFSATWCQDGDFCMGEIAGHLLSKGIHEVRGSLIADTSQFAGPLLGPAWEWDDLSYYYATPVDALSCGENTVEVSAVPGQPGAALAIRAVPEGYFSIKNQAIARAKGEDFCMARELGTETVTISGALAPRGKGVTAAVSVNDPARYFLFNMKNSMSKKGIRVSGGSQVIREGLAAAAVPLFERQSPPLQAVCAVVNRESHNLFAELTQHAVAHARTGKGDFATGAALVRQWATALGVDGDGMVIVDGSGLSRKNMISPKAMAEMLRAMVRRPVFPIYYASLPVAGSHGSMARRLTGTKGEGVVHGKVGYMTGHSSIAGYAQDQQGRWVVFAVMVNNNAGEPKEARMLQDEIVTLIVGR